MQIKQFGSVLAAALILATAPAAMAKGGKHGKKHDSVKTLSAHDTNNDGVVTRNEWRGNTATFDRLDSNRDGMLSRAEAGRDRDKKRNLDVNGDGVISRSEWTKDSAKFDRLDADRNGVLSATEMRRGKTNKGSDETMRFRGMDRNDDGLITRGEWSGNDQSFRNHDRNGDGVLSREEVRPGAQQRGR